MNSHDCIVYSGNYFSVQWYFDAAGYSQPYEYFLSTSQTQKRKLFVLVKRLAEFGVIMDKTKFRHEGNEIYALKPKPDRYLCFFSKGKRIIITNAFCKRTEKMPKNEKTTSLKAKTLFEEKYKEGD